MRTPLGFAFALPRLVARLGGREVLRAEWSGLEAYGVGLLVFGISYLCAAGLVPLFVRPMVFQVVTYAILPVILWLVLLLLYYLISLASRTFRQLGVYSASTNDPAQHLFFVVLTTFCSWFLVRSNAIWLQSLGCLWLALLGLNLVAIAIEKLLDRA